MRNKISIAIVDDSLLVRNILSDALTKTEHFSVVATGKTGIDCIEIAENAKPDFIILDIEMPIMDGLTALAEIKKKKLTSHVIMLSVLTQHGADATFKALELGAVDFIPKPSSGYQFSPEDIARVLTQKISEFTEAKAKPKVSGIQSSRSKPTTNKSLPVSAIGIGTSTGGPRALQVIFGSFPENFPLPVLVVQHMPAGFTKAFADRLNGLSNLHVKEAESGDLVKPGSAYIAPGDHQMKLVKKGRDVFIDLNQGSHVNGHRPSIEVLFESMAEVYGPEHLISLIMTGMGKDGSQAITNIHSAGGSTLAQNEISSVVFGMNRVAIELGGIDFVLPLEELVPKMLDLIKSRGNTNG